MGSTGSAGTCAVWVLGGGGVAGIAWEVGILAGLANEGITVQPGDVLIGTSAGAVGEELLGVGRLIHDVDSLPARFPVGGHKATGDLRDLFDDLQRRRARGVERRHALDDE